MLLFHGRPACFNQALLRVCLLAGAILLVVVAAVPTVAEKTLPESAAPKLARILSQQEFAGRRIQKTQLDRAMERLRHNALEYLQRAKKWLGEIKFPRAGESRFARTLRKVLAPLAEVMLWLIELVMRLGGTIAFCAFFGLLIFIAYRWYLERRADQDIQDIPFPSEVTPVSRAAVGVLLEMGRTSEAVSELRLAIRKVLEKKYGARSSETDRRLLSRVPSADPKQKVFGDTAKLFEYSAYAGKELNQEQVRSLYRTARAELGDEL